MTVEFLALGAFSAFWVLAAVVWEAHSRGASVSPIRLVLTGAIAGATIPAFSTCYLLPFVHIPLGFWNAALLGAVAGALLGAVAAFIRPRRSRSDAPAA